MEYAVERYRGNGRAVAQQNGRPHSQHEYMVPYQRQTSYPGQLPVSNQIYPGKVPPRGNHRTHQNAQAIVNYSMVDKSKVREGRQAAAVAQMYQNDLHNIDRMKELAQSQENGVGNGLVVAKPDRSKAYMKQHLSLQTKFARSQSDSQQQSSGKNGGNQDSDLTTSFDPIKDRHMWTMWRTAVNGRIVDEVRQLERIKNERPPTPSSAYDPIVPGMYGKALVVPPLKRFIRFDEESRAIATQMSNVGQGRLETSQFVYYGLPRVHVSRHRK